MYSPDEECKAMINELKRLCKQKNMTPHALAKEAGISTSTISCLMNGKTKPQVYTILLLCNVLGVNIRELFDSEQLPVKVPENAGYYIIPEEERLLDCYRHLSDTKRELLRIYLDMLVQYDDKLLTGKS